MTAKAIIEKFNLEEHVEGGYFCRTYCSQDSISTKRDGDSRPIMTTIYYMLTSERPISFFAVNESDLILFYQSGSPITIHLINQQGELESHVLGPDVTQGQVPQLIAPGGCWKAYELKQGEYCLMSEAVSPGFDYRDMAMPTMQDLKAQYPQLVERCAQFMHLD